MIAHAALILLTTQASAPPLLIDIEGRSAKEAGEIILAGQEHREIVAIDERKESSPTPPGQIMLELGEGPVRSKTGCQRIKWTASFRSLNDKPPRSAALVDAYRANEVALASDRRCEDMVYTGIERKMAPERGLALLAKLRAIADRATVTPFLCSDSTRSDLCRTDANMRSAIGSLHVWHIKEEGTQAVFWLGTPGDVVTEVRFDSATASRVVLDRRIPPPF